MSALVLKLIACITMLIDHTAASCFSVWGISNIQVPLLNITLYRLGRIIGRTAFLIYCFQLSEGVLKTRNWKHYALRLSALALLSELPFDFGLHGLKLLPGQQKSGGFAESIDWKHQNVYFTLLIGMLCLVFARLSREALWKYRQRLTGPKETGGRREGSGGTVYADGFFGMFPPSLRFAALTVLRYAVWAALAIGTGYAAKHLLHTDYGMGGVVMINIIGLSGEYWEDRFPEIGTRIVRVVCCAAGLWVCCRILNSSLEKYAAFALIPIALYNGKKGFSTKAVQYGFYLFYPVHLMVLGVLKALALGLG